jgi:hypothetical protein
MGFSHEQVFGHILCADADFIKSWFFVPVSVSDLIDYFEVHTIANQIYKIETNVFEDTYRHLCSQKNDNKSGLIETVCLKVQNRIHRLICKDDIDVSIQRQLKIIATYIDEIYELI